MEEKISSPEYHQHEEYQLRHAKLASLRRCAIEPYPPHFTPSHSIAQVNEQYQKSEVGDSESAMACTTPKVTLYGRLVLFRSMGKNIFAHILDHSSRIQLMCSREVTHVTGFVPNEEIPSAHKLIEKKLDLGDFIGVTGHLFHTHKGELTLLVTELTLLSKALLPLPDKHAGLENKELRYRKRWLDLISNQSVRDTFLLRSHMTAAIRSFFHNQDFLEVETPILQTNYGGAQARPFTTALHALDDYPMFLRISLEIPLKKLIVGGFNRIFEIGKVFRNEGIDRTHNPEFTMLEAYAVNWDYNQMRHLVEQLFYQLAQRFHASATIPFYDHQIDLTPPWKTLSMAESLTEYAQIDPSEASDEQLRAHLTNLGTLSANAIHSLPRGLLIAELFDQLVVPKLIQPHHIIDHPIETTPLCKTHRNPHLREQGIVERFESFIAGQEFCNAYSELNDPLLQRALLEQQAHNKNEGLDEPTPPLDEEFIEAITQGMPPCGGIGIGIDRLAMLMTNSSSIRDVLFFPVMKTSAHS